MKDFACQASLKNKKKSFLSCWKSFFSFIKKLFKLSVGLFFSLLFLTVIVWFILPHTLSPNNNINIVFVNNQKDVHKSEFLFASFDFDLNKTQVFLIDDQFEASIINNEEKLIKPVSFGQKMGELGSQKPRTQFMSWLTGRVVEKVLFFENSHTSVVDLQKLLREQLYTKLATFNFKNFSEIKELAYLLILLRRGEYNFLNQERTNLPITSVLPNNCSVAVINTTKIGGYAAALTSILEKSGARIIRIDSGYQDELFEETMLAYNTEKTECYYMRNVLADHLFVKAAVLTVEDQAKSLLNRYRADMVILLSDDQGF